MLSNALPKPRYCFLHSSHLSRKSHHRRQSSDMVCLSHLLDLALLGHTFHEGSICSFSQKKCELDWQIVSQIFLWQMIIK